MEISNYQNVTGKILVVEMHRKNMISFGEK